MGDWLSTTNVSPLASGLKLVFGHNPRGLTKRRKKAENL
nr:MAG TPA: hypothetical protein [Caudoviricetes sp.]DAS57896.1 MAG TPA: hypothetical protein [Caudoviricetes sp.]DAV46017.1 MAG TPA: hypothetical protein [Caudoviricetes sp.]